MESVYDIKRRMMRQCLRQVDMIRLLREKGVTATPAQFSNAIHGNLRQPKGDEIIRTSNEILTELEEKEK